MAVEHIRVTQGTSLLLHSSFSLRCSSINGTLCFSHWEAKWITRLELASTRLYQTQTQDRRRETCHYMPSQHSYIRFNSVCTVQLFLFLFLSAIKSEGMVQVCTWCDAFTCNLSRLFSASGSRSMVCLFILTEFSFSALLTSLCCNSSDTCIH